MKNKKLKMVKIRKGDAVKVVSGKDKGKMGKVEKVFGKEGKVLVGSVNQYKRHLKARSQNQPSEIVTITKPLPVANIMLVCTKCKLPTKVRIYTENNKKMRMCKKCEQII